MIIIGSGGFIGSHFCRAFPHALAIDKTHLDLCDPSITFSTKGYTHALILAGVSRLQKCSEDPHTTYQCNVQGTLKLGEEFLKRGIQPVFFSSDYVFDDTLNIAPLNTYGKQKAELEKCAVQLNALIIRLSKVYGLQRGDKTLFDEMAAQLLKGQTLLAAFDQIFAPVFIGDVIKQVIDHLQQETRGVVNVVGPKYASRLEMAQHLAAQLHVNSALVKEISLDELNDGIQRPKFLKLNSSLPSLPWMKGIEYMVKAYAQ